MPPPVAELSLIVTVAVDGVPIVAPVTSSRPIVNCGADPSRPLEFRMGIVTSWVVELPAAQLTVLVVVVLSVPALAVPCVVVSSTDAAPVVPPVRVIGIVMVPAVALTL